MEVWGTWRMGWHHCLNCADMTGGKRVGWRGLSWAGESRTGCCCLLFSISSCIWKHWKTSLCCAEVTVYKSSLVCMLELYHTLKYYGAFGKFVTVFMLFSCPPQWYCCAGNNLLVNWHVDKEANYLLDLSNVHICCLAIPNLFSLPTLFPVFKCWLI